MVQLTVHYDTGIRSTDHIPTYHSPGVHIFVRDEFLWVHVVEVPLEVFTLEVFTQGLPLRYITIILALVVTKRNMYNQPSVPYTHYSVANSSQSPAFYRST